MAGKVGILVADSGPFIKGAPLESWSRNVVTVKEVVSEIKDSNTRQRLQVLPYELSFREPSHDALRHVTEFSKKTGDYQSLSPIDLRVIALTYQLECEHGQEKGANLKTEPVKALNEPIKAKSNGIATAGFYNSVEKRRSHCVSDCDEEESSSSLLQEAMENEKTVEKNVSSDEEEDNDGEEDEQEDEDGGNWITPENLYQVCKAMGGAMEDELDDIAVGCITTDFAIQNVLLQMGLNVVSIDGMLIKRLQTYALQCKACFKISYKMGKYFCPFCGNKALIRVHVEVGMDGSVQYRPLSSKQYTHKGLRFSFALPKGGRQPAVPILTPDQRITFRLPRSREKVDPLDPDYIAKSSPFRYKDVTSRGVQIAFQHGRCVRTPQGGWRNNPNRVKKTRK